MPGQHAILSPSSASRWLECPKSARIEQTFPESTSDAADEGTLAHAIAELQLKLQLRRISFEKYEKERQELLTIDAGKFHSASMDEYVSQYVTYVLEQYAEARVETADAQIHVERRLDLTDYVQDCWGTGDVGIVGDRKLRGIDLKYGKGVEVSAEENKQMMIYALGWLKEFDGEYDIHEVCMTIFQPRLENISTWSISVPELKQWAETELKPKAELAFAGAGKFKAGSHCQFCKVRNFCKTKADYEWSISSYNKQQGTFLNPDEIADILFHADDFVKWANGIKEYALHEATTNGIEWPGHKLVEGRSNRQFSDEAKVVELLKESGWPDDSIYNKKLIGLGDMEKLVGGKKAFDSLLKPFIIKPPGKPTLAPTEDKRPMYGTRSTAAEDFAEMVED